MVHFLNFFSFFSYLSSYFLGLIDDRYVEPKREQKQHGYFFKCRFRPEVSLRKPHVKAATVFCCGFPNIA
jgi:hypothetical protein